MRVQNPYGFLPAMPSALANFLKRSSRNLPPQTSGTRAKQNFIYATKVFFSRWEHRQNFAHCRPPVCIQDTVGPRGFLPSQNDAAVQLFDLLSHLLLMKPDLRIKECEVVTVHCLEVGGIQRLPDAACRQPDKHANDVQAPLG